MIEILSSPMATMFLWSFVYLAALIVAMAPGSLKGELAMLGFLGLTYYTYQAGADSSVWPAFGAFLLGVVLMMIEFSVGMGTIVFGLGSVAAVAYSGLLLFGDWNTALWVTGGSFFLTFIMSVGLMFWLPESFLGRIAKSVTVPEAKPQKPRQVWLKKGDRGSANGSLRPSGRVLFGEKEADVVALEGFIDDGCEVEVVSATLQKVVVRLVDSSAKEA